MDEFDREFIRYLIYLGLFVLSIIICLAFCSGQVVKEINKTKQEIVKLKFKKNKTEEDEKNLMLAEMKREELFARYYGRRR